MTAGADWKPGTGQRIEKLYAWIAEEPDGEGIIAVRLRDGVGPMIGADMARIESFRDAAQAVARDLGVRVRLKVFSGGVTIDEVEP